MKEAERIGALAKELKIDPSEVEVNDVLENTFSLKDGRTYMVVDEDEAREAVVNEIDVLLDDLGIEGFTPAFQEWIKENALDTNWFEDTIRESNQSYVEDIEDEDGEYGSRLLEELVETGLYTVEEVESEDFDVEEAKERYVDYLSDVDDPIEYFIDNYGKETFKYALKHGDIDLDIQAIADEAIVWDGVAHFLARYDGREIELDNGLFAYRVD